MLLQPEHEVEIKILQGSVLVNLRLRLIGRPSQGRTFQVKPPMDGVVGAEQVSHYDKTDLVHHVHTGQDGQEREKQIRMLAMVCKLEKSISTT